MNEGRSDILQYFVALAIPSLVVEYFKYIIINYSTVRRFHLTVYYRNKYNFYCFEPCSRYFHGTFLSHQAFQKTDLFSLFTSLLFNKMNSRFEYVIAWGRGQLRINFTSIFKVFKKLPESPSIWKTLKIKVKL